MQGNAKSEKSFQNAVNTKNEKEGKLFSSSLEIELVGLSRGSFGWFIDQAIVLDGRCSWCRGGLGFDFEERTEFHGDIAHYTVNFTGTVGNEHEDIMSHDNTSHDIDRIVTSTDQHNESEVSVHAVCEETETFEAKIRPFESADHKESAVSRIEEIASWSVRNDEGWESRIIPCETRWETEHEI